MTRHRLVAFGLDASMLPLQSGRRRNAALSLLQAPGERLPIADQQLDAIFAECSLSVMADADWALEEFGRTLKGDGILILSDIYARNPNGVSALRRLPSNSCLSGALSQQQVADKLHTHGFHIVAWEDHSDAMKHLAAQLILACGSMQQFWQRAAPGDGAEDIQQAVQQAKPGYYLLIARKI
jgi:ubiquinone/menaquinone biosynthesis C-methylase UbiE